MVDGKNLGVDCVIGVIGLRAGLVNVNELLTLVLEVLSIGLLRLRFDIFISLC
jgi:hypothetical protein